MVFPGHFHHRLPSGKSFQVPFERPMEETFPRRKKRWKRVISWHPQNGSWNNCFMEVIEKKGPGLGWYLCPKNDNVTVGHFLVAVEFIRRCLCTLRFRYGRWKESRPARVEGPFIYKHHVHVAGNKGQKYDLQTRISWHLWLESSYSPLSCFVFKSKRAKVFKSCSKHNSCEVALGHVNQRFLLWTLGIYMLAMEFPPP